MSGPLSLCLPWKHVPASGGMDDYWIYKPKGRGKGRYIAVMTYGAKYNIDFEPPSGLNKFVGHDVREEDVDGIVLHHERTGEPQLTSWEKLKKKLLRL